VFACIECGREDQPYGYNRCARCFIREQSVMINNSPALACCARPPSLAMITSPTVDEVLDRRCIALAAPADGTTTSVVLTSQSARLPQPHVIAGTKIDNAGPNHPPSTRTRQPAAAHRSPAKARLEPGDRNDGRPLSATNCRIRL
jgi:hypothetical protein